MLARLLGLQEVDADGTLNVISRKISGQDVDQIPIESSANSVLDLRLVDRFPHCRRYLFMDEEKVHSIHAWEAGRGLHDDFLSRSYLLLLSSDFYGATFASSALIVANLSFQGLVSSCDNLVEREVDSPNKVVV